MKAAFALAASLSLASASLLPRQLDQIPQCALSCALTSLGSTGCQTTDFACICQASAFISSLLPCVQGACSAAELETTVQGARGLCLAAGVTLVIPTGAAETGSSSTSEAASTETGPATTAPPSTSGTASAEVETSTSQAPATTVRGNGTQTTGTRPPTATGTEPGAASRNTVALGGLGAIVALVAAFL